MNSPRPHLREVAAGSTSPVPSGGEVSKPVCDGRMQRPAEYRDRLGRKRRRSNFVENPEFLVYDSSGVREGFALPTGEQPITEHINVGDNNGRVFLVIAFPHAAGMPSRLDGLVNDVLNWARDYAFLLDHNPCEWFQLAEVLLV
jgi:hypothetical protein